VSKANELVAREITVSVGGLCSAATVPTLKVFRAVGIPMIIPGANSSDLLAPRYDNVFLLAARDGQEIVVTLKTAKGTAAVANG
jgi:branched-chain amino acid transport system substrate-binding protein